MLSVINNFFNKLNENGIVYCHWKSNERIENFLEGESDLDLLFYNSDKEKVKKIFEQIDAKKFEALPLKKYENIIDYLHVDKKTGKLIHFHVYFKLELGEPNVKQYLVPWVDEILRNRVKHENFDVWIPSHEHELILLIIREGLRIPDLKKLIIKNRFYNFLFQESVISEYNWLIKRTNKILFVSIVNRLFHKDMNILNALENIFDNGFSFDRISYLDNTLQNFKNKNRTKSSIYANFIFIKNIFKTKLFNKIINISKKRINPRSGLIVAIVGSDGAGKSTLIKNLELEFRKKISVKNIYLGLPKNNIFVIISKFGFKAIFNLLIKKRKLNKAFKFRNDGLLVFCDRFPQSEYYNIMDGPLISYDSNTKNLLKKWFSKIENKEYEKMYNSNIDLLIKLKVNKETSSSRGSLSLEFAEKKTDVINALSFSSFSKIYELDAIDNPAEEITRKAMNIIWDNIK